MSGGRVSRRAFTGVSRPSVRRRRQTGARLGEYPIVFENRRHGKSKVNMKEAVRSILMILSLGTAHFFGLDRLTGAIEGVRTHSRRFSRKRRIVLTRA